MIPYLQQLLERAQPDGGFLTTQTGNTRPDSTAWATIILSNFESHEAILKQSYDYLIAFQQEDGRVSIAPKHFEAYWPTPLATLAWASSPSHRSNYSKGIQFLLETSGKHWKKKPQSVLDHNPSFKGWAWIDDTHSWVETTSLALIALHNAGYESHPRLKEATEMLLDRQLPHGGWNYGNTKVFGQELRPSPEDTGAALSALVGRTSESSVEKSLDYLKAELPRLKTPIALGWSLLGYQSWANTLPHGEQWIHETITRSHRYGGYDTSSLCLLLTPLLSPYGLKNPQPRENPIDTHDNNPTAVS